MTLKEVRVTTPRSARDAAASSPISAQAATASVIHSFMRRGKKERKRGESISMFLFVVVVIYLLFPRLSTSMRCVSVGKKRVVKYHCSL